MERESWKSRTGFLLAAIGSAIGLGNIWRFPQMVSKNGGGAFLVPYLIALFVCGIPILILEFSIGHKLRGSAPSVFKRIKASNNKSFQFLGWFGVVVAMFGIQVYYCVVIGWCLYYLIAAFGIINFASFNPGAFFTDIIGKGSFFSFHSPGAWILVAVILVWLLNLFFVFRGVEKGIERANKIFMPLLFAITIILIIRSAMLPGASVGIKKYLIPNFKKLLDGNVWKDAFSQIFFTLSLSFGIMIVYASYLPKKTNLKRNAMLTAFINCGFSIIVGFLVFSVMGYYAEQTGKTVAQAIGSGGPGMAFVTFPTAISKMGGLKEVFWIAFFLCLLFAGLSSSMSLFEAFTSSVKDKLGTSRTKATLITAGIGFILSILFASRGAGINWLDAVDHAMTNYGLILTGIFNCIIIGWVYKAKVLRRHIFAVDGTKIGMWWEICIKFFTPLVLTIIFIWGLIVTFRSKSSTYIIIGWSWIVGMAIVSAVISNFEWKNKKALELGHHYEDEDNPLPYS